MEVGHFCWGKGIFGAVSLGLFLLSVPVIVSLSVAGEVPTIPGAQYIGSQRCKDCHQESSVKYWQTQMGRIFSKGPRNALERQDCESCHGPSSKHLEDPGNPKNNIRFGKKAAQPVAAQNAVCLQCHEKGERLFWKGSAHESRNVACTNCHKVMERVSTDKGLLTKVKENDVCAQCHPVRRAQLLRSSHMPLREGKLKCSDCHNPHGTVTAKLIRENSVNENCYRCHAERRGPLLWEHAPVRENCLACHDAHGTINDKLLKVKMPRLCNQCHTESGHASTPYFATSRFVFNRSCTNCHPQIHGSNHPSGNRFNR